VTIPLPTRLASPRRLLLFWSGAAVAAIVAAPLCVRADVPGGLAVYASFRAFCHQQPERSFLLGGFPLAVCARCAGIYVGLLLSAAARLRLGLGALAAAAACAGFSWTLEVLELAESPGSVRLLTGLVLGGGLGGYILDGSGSVGRGRRRGGGRGTRYADATSAIKAKRVPGASWSCPPPPERSGSSQGTRYDRIPPLRIP
jgi:uncharacterized membrane protein